MQGRPQAGEVRQRIEAYEQMMNAFAEQAKTFWKSMGAAGEPIALDVESFAQKQSAYLRWLEQAERASGASLPCLSYDNWPGPGDSDGGGWDRLS